MKLGKTHLIVSLSLVAASIAYNVWVFTRPARRSTAPGPAPLVEALAPSGPMVTGEQAAAPIDPATVAAPPDVDLVRAPEWPRNPFANVVLRRVDVEAAPAAAVPEVEPDVAVASILHSSERRLAVVNGRIVRAGDRIGSTTIVDIQPRAIVVESPRGGRRVVELRASLTTKESK